ncbi:WD repeat protein [Schizosaccharomyces octosporus yFS286]|uniref:WD repeat protein n=1 Tax=Schizosaccharomyces octosporus (strain yFS286) TaxID=483514 RepID=S9Q0Q4_SCHOY|nr:WD repeat protein [Schizosaccharomyces octosporus yFS286]EPX74876.1 WD repeat protein [Schizosaccharomyces octosporus yFS286]
MNDRNSEHSTSSRTHRSIMSFNTNETGSDGYTETSNYMTETGGDTISSANDGYGVAFPQPRHGFEEEYNNAEYINMLEQVFYMYYTDKRHRGVISKKSAEATESIHDWRMRERLKTISAALLLCLNIGVDPPDIIKPNPCAKYECWIDPFSLPASKALEAIGKNLQQQYETLSMRTRYRHYLDPAIEEVKKLCIAQRRNAKEERILFHYNGHGVPMPTSSGEIWVFNKNYTQYIPVSLYDLQTWLGAPCIYVYDCSAAGNIIANFIRFAEQRDREAFRLAKQNPNILAMPSHATSIQLAACGPKETLPMNPDLPADLFTSCLTSPIEISVRWYVLQNPFPSKLNLNMLLKIPGRLQDRRTPLGELNWIFTAITDTIAWNVFPKHLFRRLFRQDLMVAALFRNFLLAERIMLVHSCHPQSSPPLPPTHDHPMWNSWDLAIDNCLSQLPDMLDAESKGASYEYKHSMFFSEQLTAFEVWLSQGLITRKPPDQLPLVLQVLLSQVHRLRALILLSKFLDLGIWAVDLALSIGIFPYVLKLLQSPAIELKPVLVFIWARILAVDDSCQADLLKDNGYGYFVQILNPNSSIFPSSNISEHRAMCAFILSIFCRGFPQGQLACLGPQVLSHCLSHLSSPDSLLRQWACLCIAQLWDNYSEAKWSAIRDNAHVRLGEIVFDPVPEVRASALVAFTTFMGFPEKTEEVIAIETYIAFSALVAMSDASPMVRRELTIFLSHFVVCYKKKFIVVAYEDSISLNPRKKRHTPISESTIFDTVWQAILSLSADPSVEVSMAAEAIVNYVYQSILNSSLQDEFSAFVSKSLPVPRNPVSAQDTVTENTSLRGDSRSYSASRASAERKKLNRSFSLTKSLKGLALSFSGNDKASDILSLNGESKASDYGASRLTDAKIPVPPSFNSIEYQSELDMPLTSHFFDWSRKYYTEPQMRPNEDDEPGSICYNQRLWRRNRNEKLIYQTRPLAELSGNNHWNQQVSSVNNVFTPKKLIFHQFEDQLVSLSTNNLIQVWDWSRSKCLNAFKTDANLRSDVMDMQLLNEDDIALLMTVTSEGVVRLYRNYDTEDIELVTSWNALGDLISGDRDAGLLLNWQQNCGHLLVAGDVRVIRIWDASKELCHSSLPARSSNSITSLTSDLVGCNVIVAGFSDGALRVYDKRLPARESMTDVWKEHGSRIVNLEMQSSGMRELISASTDGEVKLWDIRSNHSLLTIPAHANNLTSLSTHSHAPVFATGSSNQYVKVWSTDGKNINTFRESSRFLTHSKLGGLSCLKFHPHHLMLACGDSTDNRINFYSCNKNELITNAVNEYY